MSDDNSSKNINYEKKNSAFRTREDREREENGDSVFSAIGIINTGLLNAPPPVGIQRQSY